MSVRDKILTTPANEAEAPGICESIITARAGMTLARCRPDSQYSKLVLASIKSPTWSLHPLTHGLIVSLMAATRFLPASAK